MAKLFPALEPRHLWHNCSSLLCMFSAFMAKEKGISTVEAQTEAYELYSSSSHAI